MKNRIKYFAFLLLVVVSCLVNAQNLPSVQKISVAAPTNVKIDGKATEWQYQAFSNATDFFYTIANDANNLYIIINTNYEVSAQKIVAGSITFTFSSDDKNNKITPVILSYPKMTAMSSQGVSNTLRENPTNEAIIALDKRLNDNTKEIPVTGIKEITEPAISVYNELGIKTAQHIDDKKTYTIEMAIPLKYLKDVINSAGAFNYKFLVNGLSGSGTRVFGGSNLNAEPTDAPVAHGGANYLMAPTYLSASYTLAK